MATFFNPGAALDAARALRRARRVLIITGFTVELDMPETDGPPGAAVLGRALRRLGARVTHVTDAANVPLVEAVLKTPTSPRAWRSIRLTPAAPRGCSPTRSRRIRLSLIHI